MSLKDNITSSYGARIYKKTTKLKDAKMKMAKAKNQFIFLQKCLAHNLIPKSLCVQSPLRSRRTQNIVKEFRLGLLRCAKNEAKHRFFSQTEIVRNMQEELQSIVNEEDMEMIDRVTEKAREGMFVRQKIDS